MSQLPSSVHSSINSSGLSWCRKVVVCFFITTFILFANVCQAQIDRVRFDRIGQREGLEQLRIYSVIQDREGFIWFGTQNGLVKFNGYDFRVFTFDPGNPNSLADNFINNLALGHDGTIWIGTESGAVDSFDPNTEVFTHHALDDSPVVTQPVEHVYVDSNGTVWVSRRGGGLFIRKNEGGFIPLMGSPENTVDLQATTVLQILMCHSDEIWFSLKDIGPARYDSTSGRLHTLEEYQADRSGDAVLHELADGNLFIGTWGAGIFRYDDESLSSFPIADNRSDLRPLYIKEILQNSQGGLWVATARSGLWYYDPATRQSRQYTNSPADPLSLVSNDIEALFEDRSETLWLGTLNGVSKYNRYKYKFHFQRLSDKGTQVLSIRENPAGGLWIGTYLHGLTSVDNAGNVRASVDFVTQPPSARNTVYSIEAAGSGELLIGTADQGVFSLAGNSTRPQQTSVPLHIADILRDSYGTIWLATSVNGLCRYHPENGRVETWSFNVLPEYQDRLFDAVTLFEDSGRYLWVGTENGGVLRLHPDRRSYDHYYHDAEEPGGISDNRISCFAEDQQGYIWIGTRKGLNRFTPATETFEQFYTQDGLANDAVLALLCDGGGDVWVSTNNNLTRIETATLAMRTFDMHAGLEGVEFSARACILGSNGDLLFGTNDGLLRFNPAELEDNPHRPAVVITSNTVLDHTRLRGRDYDDLSDLRLSYFENYFSFEFAALDFAETSANRFAYMLEGADKDWVHAGNRRSASYIQVPPGEYVFRVKAANNDGLWSETPAEVRISILPPFWDTNEFRALVIILLVSAAFTAYKVRTASIRKQRNLLQREVNERKEAEKKLLANRARLRSLANQLILAEEKERRRISVALHEKIGHALLLAKVKMRDQLEHTDQAEDEKSIQETIKLLEDTIRHTRTMTVEISPPSLHQFGIEAAAESLLERFGKEYGIRTVINADGQRKVPFDTAILLYQALSELLVNVFKHAQADLVKVDISDDGSAIRVVVRDNGKGFNVDSVLNNEDDFSGYGLFSIRERLESIHGNLTIESEIGDGCKITMTAPMSDSNSEGDDE